jgi:single-stranded-DNA-specific exonuclease
MEISAYHAGFALAPRINAVGRLSHAIEAVRMLCTKDGVKAKRLAQEAQGFNLSRQKMVDTAVEEAFIAIEKKEIPLLIIQKKRDWNEGIIGLISSKITDRYRRPSIVMTKTEGGWKGSARSVKGFDIIAFLRSLKILKHVGGHPQAAGFSLTDEELPLFEKKINDRIHEVPPPKDKELHVDLELRLSDITDKLADALKDLAPFGIGNPTPVFQSKAKVLFINAMGKTKQHMKFVGQDVEKKTHQLECIYFSPSEEQKKLLIAGGTVEIIYTIETSYWQGKKQLKCFIKAVRRMV